MSPRPLRQRWMNPIGLLQPQEAALRGVLLDPRELSRVASRPFTAACVRRPRSTIAAACGGEATLLVNARRARSDSSVGPASELPGGCSGITRVSTPMLLALWGRVVGPRLRILIADERSRRTRDRCLRRFRRGA